ncbi:hypothetical protein JMUB7525_27130 [Staphylococcus aureus]
MSSVYSRWRERRKVKKAIDSGTLSQSDFDIELLSQIQPRGGVNFKNDFYVRKGTGYETCITIYETPTDVEDFWLGQIMTICLLYTSPSPRDMRRSRMPSSA